MARPYREVCGFGDELRQAKARIAELEGVLRNLVDKLDTIDKAVTGVFVMAKIHGCEYSGPNYGEELKAARKVLNHE